MRLMNMALQVKEQMNKQDQFRTFPGRLFIELYYFKICLKNLSNTA